MYTLSQTSGYVVRDADGAMIPDDPRNSDWSAYLAWLAEGNTPNPVPPAAPATSNVSIISLRQFYEQAAIAGIITQAEAMAAMQGVLPQKIKDAIAQLPAAAQFDATMKLSGAGSLELANPLVAPMAAFFGMDAAQTQAFFNAAGAL